MAKFYIIRNGGDGASDTVVQRGDGDYSAVLVEHGGRRVYRSWRGAEQHRAWTGERDGNGMYAAVEAVEACSLEHALEIAQGVR